MGGSGTRRVSGVFVKMILILNGCNQVFDGGV